jgi:carboxypeptidase T
MRALFEQERIAVHVDFHSYSQVIVYPWSYKRDDPPDRAELAALAERLASAMTAAHGEPYAIRAGSELTRGAAGTAGDWSYGTYGALSFLVELRPRSAAEGGFELPAEQIEPTCDESMAGVLTLAEAMIDHPPR